jgi:hypothetical protein
MVTIAATTIQNVLFLTSPPDGFPRGPIYRELVRPLEDCLVQSAKDVDEYDTQNDAQRQPSSGFPIPRPDAYLHDIGQSRHSNNIGARDICLAAVWLVWPNQGFPLCVQTKHAPLLRHNWHFAARGWGFVLGLDLMTITRSDQKGNDEDDGE